MKFVIVEQGGKQYRAAETGWWGKRSPGLSAAAPFP